MRREKIAKKGKIITNKMQNLEIFLARLAIYQISKISKLKVVNMYVFGLSAVWEIWMMRMMVNIF